MEAASVVKPSQMIRVCVYEQFVSMLMLKGNVRIKIDKTCRVAKYVQKFFFVNF
jgi:hypothetical protein